MSKIVSGLGHALRLGLEKGVDGFKRRRLRAVGAWRAQLAHVRKPHADVEPHRGVAVQVDPFEKANYVKPGNHI